MKWKILLTVVFLVSCSSKQKISEQNLCQQLKSKYQELGSPSKIIFVLPKNWNSSRANLSFWQRDADNKWKKEEQEIDVMIGRSGLGLGLDWYHLQRFYKTVPLKKEGDGKTPFGMYLLGKKFGKLPAGDFNQTDNFIELNEGTKCVDDADSPYYSRIVETTKGAVLVEPTWKSAEDMYKEPFYQQGIVVDYRTKGVDKSGSCIFMHLENTSVKGTSGCIATQKVHLDKIYEFAKDYEPVMIALLTQGFFKLHQECLLVD
jgi:L,D-peptidoglycan transpeptidase YkuD (ErfK/YbiS/YcfS/YnhG family)